MDAQGDPLDWDTEATVRWLGATFPFSPETMERFRTGVKTENEEDTTVKRESDGPSSPSRGEQSTQLEEHHQPTKEPKEISLLKVPLQVWRGTPANPVHNLSQDVSTVHPPKRRDVDVMMLGDSDGADNEDIGAMDVDHQGDPEGSSLLDRSFEPKADRSSMATSMGLGITHPTAHPNKVARTLVSTEEPSQQGLTSMASTSKSKGKVPVSQDLKSSNVTGKSKTAKNHLHCRSRIGLNIYELFFDNDCVSPGSDDDDWSMPSSELPRKSIPLAYKWAIQSKMKRILRTPPIFDTPFGQTVYAPVERKERDVPVKLLSTSDTSKGITVSTSTWDTIFEDKSRTRVEVGLTEQDTTMVDFRTLTGGSAVNDKPKKRMEDDPLLPIYGDSDASAYTTDEELYREVEKEERERSMINVKPAKAQLVLQRDAIQAAIEEYKIEHEGQWIESHKPQLDKWRHLKYLTLMRESNPVDAVGKLKDAINQLSKVRLPSLIGALLKSQYKSRDEVRKACKAMDWTLTHLWETQWKLELVQGPVPPKDDHVERPSNSASRPKRDIVAQLSGDDDDDLLAEERRQRELDAAFIDDSELYADNASTDGSTTDTLSEGDIRMSDHAVTTRQRARSRKSSAIKHGRPLSLPSPTSPGDSPQSQQQDDMDLDGTVVRRRNSKIQTNHDCIMESSDAKRESYPSDSDGVGRPVRKLSRLGSGSLSPAPNYIDLEDDESLKPKRKRLVKASSFKGAVPALKASSAKTNNNISTSSPDKGNGTSQQDEETRSQPTKKDTGTRSVISISSMDSVHLSTGELLKGNSHDNPLDLDESMSSATDTESDSDSDSDYGSDSESESSDDLEMSSSDNIKPMDVPNWRELLRDDNALMQELRRVRKLVSIGERVASTDPLISAWQEYVEAMELDCGDSISFHEFLMWKDQGNNTVEYRIRSKEAAAAQAVADKLAVQKARQERRRLKAAERKKIKRGDGKDDVTDSGKRSQEPRIKRSPEGSPSISHGEMTGIEVHESIDKDPHHSSAAATSSGTSKCKTVSSAKSKSEESNKGRGSSTCPATVDGGATVDSGGNETDKPKRASSVKTSISQDSQGKIPVDKVKASGVDSFKFMKRPRPVRNRFGDTSEGHSDSENEAAESRKRQTKKTVIRPMVKEGEDVLKLRKDAARNEMEHRKRIEEQEKRAKLRTTGPLKEGEILINPGHKKTEQPVVIPSFLAENLKPHQLEGVRFMWKNVVMFNGGCILAHSMGLGKTFQVVAFIYVLLRERHARNKDIPEKLQSGRVLLLMPPIVLQNWEDEFNKWIPEEERHIIQLRKLVSAEKTASARLQKMEGWYNEGGVFLLGYNLFRDSCMGKGSQGYPTTIQQFQSMLQAGSSLVIADEGHQLKNITGKLALAVNRIETKSRIILTGHPLQNRLEEYYCMIDFVRPNFLGDINAFRANYIRPIEAGLYSESSVFENKASMKRLKVLTELIKNFVMRKDQSVLKLALPKKTEFVISCKLSEMQSFLYNATLINLKKRRSKTVGSKEPQNPQADPSQAAQAVVTPTEPPQAAAPAEPPQAAIPSESLTRAIGEDSDDELAKEELEEAQHVLNQNKDILQWGDRSFQESNVLDIANGYKTRILIDILKECRMINEKVLIFTRSIPTFDYIEYAATNAGFNVMKLDGSTPMGDRQDMINAFNSTASKYDAFLISSGAGSQGVNLVSASRVVLYDVGWNPSHDEQAIARAYRYGQKKPVFVYRLQTFGTWEDRLYKLNIYKLGLANRVVDKKNPVKAFTKTEMKTYFQAPPAEVQLWATDLNMERFFETPDNNDAVLKAMIGKNKDAITSIVLQSELVREEASDLTEADLIEIEKMIEDEKRRIDGVAPSSTAPTQMQLKPVMPSASLQAQMQQQLLAQIRIQAQAQARTTTAAPQELSNHNWTLGAPTRAESHSREWAMEPMRVNLAQRGQNYGQGTPAVANMGAIQVVEHGQQGQQPRSHQYLASSSMPIQAGQGPTLLGHRRANVVSMPMQSAPVQPPTTATVARIPWAQSSTASPRTGTQHMPIVIREGSDLGRISENGQTQANQDGQKGKSNDTAELTFQEALAQHMETQL
ncbi:hypothetical protein BGX31_002677 [Mortierella sp. GBA43]|nr:hypothetical protein BGX31_002677 [Mortierella sp. GBA43]